MTHFFDFIAAFMLAAGAQTFFAWQWPMSGKDESMKLLGISLFNAAWFAWIVTRALGFAQ